MLGILKGLKITFQHALKAKVTQIYPYVKPELPERSRGLIQLIREEETGVLRCEACLLCEKACPPRAIIIEHSQRDFFRRRPLFRPRTFGGFYAPRMALTAPYEGKIVPSAVDAAGDEASPDLVEIDQLLARAGLEEGDAMAMLKAIQETFGYVPQAAAKRASELTGIDLSDLYATVTASPAFRLKPTKPNDRMKQFASGGGDG